MAKHRSIFASIDFAMIWFNTSLLPIQPLGAVKFQSNDDTFHARKLISKWSPGKWRPFCLDANLLRCPGTPVWLSLPIGNHYLATAGDISSWKASYHASLCVWLNALSIQKWLIFSGRNFAEQNKILRVGVYLHGSSSCTILLNFTNFSSWP